VTIVEKTYETTNTTELKQVYEDLAFGERRPRPGSKP